MPKTREGQLDLRFLDVNVTQQKSASGMGVIKLANATGGANVPMFIGYNGAAVPGNRVWEFENDQIIFYVPVTYPGAPTSAVVWYFATGATQALAANCGYVTNRGTQVDCSLPTTGCVALQTIRIEGMGTGGWKISQGAGQSIIVGNQTTTLGAGGSITCGHYTDGLELICLVDNVTFKVVNLHGSPLTIV